MVMRIVPLGSERTNDFSLGQGLVGIAGAIDNAFTHGPAALVAENFQDDGLEAAGVRDSNGVSVIVSPSSVEAQKQAAQAGGGSQEARSPRSGTSRTAGFRSTGIWCWGTRAEVEEEPNPGEPEQRKQPELEKEMLAALQISRASVW